MSTSHIARVINFSGIVSVRVTPIGQFLCDMSVFRVVKEYKGPHADYQKCLVVECNGVAFRVASMDEMYSGRARQNLNEMGITNKTTFQSVMGGIIASNIRAAIRGGVVVVNVCKETAEAFGMLPEWTEAMSCIAARRQASTEAEARACA